MAEKIKLGIAVAFVVAGIFGFYYLSQSLMIVRVAAVLGGLVLAAIVAFQTEAGKRFFVFSQESVAELKKVVWPTRKETAQTTGIVFLFVVVMAIFLWAVDSILLSVVQMIMGREAG
ncbi:MAG: preprotein translocase subunit SecE [Burkholderiales bacterium]|jgi:preprotein translocase subunit SecE